MQLIFQINIVIIMKSSFLSISLLVLLIILAKCDARLLKKRSGNGYNHSYKDDDVYIIQDDDYSDNDNNNIWLFLLPFLFANRRYGGIFGGYGYGYMY
jgi:hypothetical protein